MEKAIETALEAIPGIDAYVIAFDVALAVAECS